MSEFLRKKQGCSEVNKQQDREQESHYSYQVHGLPQLLAGLHIQKGHGKEKRGEEKHDNVLHAGLLDSEPRRRRKARTIPKSIFHGCAFSWSKGNLKKL
jgi:hypothetical protein